MKNTKSMLTLILAGTVSFSAGLWFYSTQSTLSTLEITVAAVVLILVVFSFIIGYKRIKNERKGLPGDDELSNQIKQKAASKAFSVSFILWVMILAFSIEKELSIEISIGIGILGMGFIFISFWIFYSIRGIDNEN